MIRLLKPDADPTLFLTQVDAEPAPPTTVQQVSQPFHTEAGDADMEEAHSGATLVIEDEDTVGAEMEEILEKGEEVEQRLPVTEEHVGEPSKREDDVMDIVRQITSEAEPSVPARVPEDTYLESNREEITRKNEVRGEREQPSLTTEEAAAILASRNPDVDIVDANLEAERFEGPYDVLERREVVIVTDEEEETEEVPHAAVLTYQRRPARDETSEQRSAVGLLRDTPRKRAEGNVMSPARSPVRAPTRRRRLLIDEESEVEDGVFFTPLDAQPSQRRPDAPAGVTANERERREKKRKGKTIAAPIKKKQRRPSTTLVIQEGERPDTDDESEEDKALRFERRSKQTYDEARGASGQGSESAKVQFRKI